MGCTTCGEPALFETAAELAWAAGPEGVVLREVARVLNQVLDERVEAGGQLPVRRLGGDARLRAARPTRRAARDAALEATLRVDAGLALDLPLARDRDGSSALDCG